MNIQFLKTYSEVEKLSQKCIKRCGIIPINFKIDGNHTFVMAVDAQYGQLTDPGGTVEYNETIVETGFREFKEETSDVFNNMYPDIQSIQNNFYCGVVDYVKLVVIIFVIIPSVNNNINIQTLCEKYIYNANVENSGLLCIPVKQLNLISKEPIVSNENVKNIYKYSGIRIENLETLNLLRKIFNKRCILTYPILYSRIKGIINYVVSRFYKNLNNGCVSSLTVGWGDTSLN